jgi:hypothetical protein
MTTQELPTRLRGAVLLQLPAEVPQPRRRDAEAEQPDALISQRSLLLAAAGAAGAVWAGALWLSGHVHPDRTLTAVALFAHLTGLVAGLGAVLVVEWTGLLWLLGKRRLCDVLQLAHGCHLIIWLGLALLTLSGALLHPDLTALRTQVKLGAVLILALNGVQSVALQRRLAAVTGSPPRHLLVWSSGSAALSQTAWWTATVIGFLSHQAH